MAVSVPTSGIVTEYMNNDSPPSGITSTVILKNVTEEHSNTSISYQSQNKLEDDGINDLKRAKVVDPSFNDTMSILLI